MTREESARRIQQLLDANNCTESKRRALALRVRELEATVLALQRELIRLKEKGSSAGEISATKEPPA